MTGIPVLNALFAGEQEILEKKVYLGRRRVTEAIPLYFACNSNQTRSNFLSLHPQYLLYLLVRGTSIAPMTYRGFLLHQNMPISTSKCHKFLKVKL